MPIANDDNAAVCELALRCDGDHRFALQMSYPVTVTAFARTVTEARCPTCGSGRIFFATDSRETDKRLALAAEGAW